MAIENKMIPECKTPRDLLSVFSKPCEKVNSSLYVRPAWAPSDPGNWRNHRVGRAAVRRFSKFCKGPLRLADALRSASQRLHPIPGADGYPILQTSEGAEALTLADADKSKMIYLLWVGAVGCVRYASELVRR